MQAQARDSKHPGRRPRRWAAVALLAALALVVAVVADGCARPEEVASRPPEAGPAEPPPPATFVGRPVCAGCHAGQERAWRGSDHDRAMAEATVESVLGDFSGVTLSHFGVTSTFFTRQGEPWVRTQGPDGEMADYRVAYTFGAEPLQQYLVEQPGGRLQALPLAWDSRPAQQGGQRWFHLSPEEAVPPGDPLHWAGPYQRWNSMCAECHSTDLKKGYAAAEDRYRTTWAEIDVSCEACHGPGSRHVEWARARGQGGGPADDSPDQGLLVRLGKGATWGIDPASGKPRRLTAGDAQGEIDACARCHSRRTAITESYEPGRPLLDTHRPVLLEEELYYSDGQIRGEVYVYGSFLQSKMARRGVTCSDCHEPHGLGLRAPGNALCTRCHGPAYDAPAHHHHRQGAEGSRCVDCHMPATPYMVVDPRRDHSLRVPRPDLAARLGSPDPCTGCHAERSPDWAAGVVAEWTGREPPPGPHYGEALLAGRQRRPGAAAALAATATDPEVPAIARATALELLRTNPGPQAPAAVERALSDPDPLVRLGAALALETVAPERRAGLARPLLADPVRGVRIEAARALAAGPPELLSAADRAALEPALEEHRRAQLANADRPEAHLELAWLHLRAGDGAAAEAAYREALALEPAYAPAAVNLADLYRRLGRDAEGEEPLRRALELNPGDAVLHHALGLLLVRRERLAEALPELARAVELAPAEPRYAQVYRLALEAAGHRPIPSSTGSTGSIGRKEIDP